MFLRIPVLQVSPFLFCVQLLLDRGATSLSSLNTLKNDGLGGGVLLRG